MAGPPRLTPANGIKEEHGRTVHWGKGYGSNILSSISQKDKNHDYFCEERERIKLIKYLSTYPKRIIIYSSIFKNTFQLLQNFKNRLKGLIFCPNKKKKKKKNF